MNFSEEIERLNLYNLGEGNGTPLQRSCLENPRDGRTWWAAVCGVTQSRKRLKWLSSSSSCFSGEGNGNPLQYSCLENPMDGGAWWAAVHGVTKSQTRLSDFNFHFENSLALPFFEIGMKIDLFQSCGHCWVLQLCGHIECSTFTASSFRIWNSSTGIPSPPLALWHPIPALHGR